MTKSGDSVPDSAWDRVGQLERGTGDLLGWFARGRRELDGARGGEGGAARRGCSVRFAGAGAASLRRCGDVCNGVWGYDQSAARPMARLAGPSVQRKGDLAMARRRWAAGN